MLRFFESVPKLLSQIVYIFFHGKFMRILNKAAFCFLMANFLVNFRARFHYEREMKHIFFVLLIFTSLKSMQTLSEATKSIKETKNTPLHTCIENKS